MQSATPSYTMFPLPLFFTSFAFNSIVFNSKIAIARVFARCILPELASDGKEKILYFFDDFIFPPTHQALSTLINYYLIF